MMRELNPVYRAAWDAVKGTGSYYYGDPDKVEAAGESLVFPCLFRLLRTSDTVNNSIQGSTYLERNENFLVCIKTDDFPDLEEEALENQAYGYAMAFLEQLRGNPSIRFNYPSTFNIYRRTLQQFAICIGFPLQVRDVMEDWLC